MHRPRWTRRQVHASGICPRPTSAVLAITTRPPTACDPTSVVVSRGVIDRACGAVGSSSSLASLKAYHIRKEGKDRNWACCIVLHIFHSARLVLHRGDVPIATMKLCGAMRCCQELSIFSSLVWLPDCQVTVIMSWWLPSQPAQVDGHILIAYLPEPGSSAGRSRDGVASRAALYEFAGKLSGAAV
ncbi:hypothetical protein C8R45DRAFT_1081508 [Mycena sanguinolenta]|nr:hypothetical protein C8R45DRAFT_1081508 [Mycena sanguinolenta]